MAFVLNSNARLLRPFSQSIGADLGKVSGSQLSRVKLQRQIPRAASSVQQQQSGTVAPETKVSTSTAIKFKGVHHVGLLCENLERSLEFYQGVLGLETNPNRNNRLPFRGAWFWVGEEMIHIMELPNPDPVTGRPAYGGRDRHLCVELESLDGLRISLTNAGISFKESIDGTPAVFCRDPDGNGLEFTLA